MTITQMDERELSLLILRSVRGFGVILFVGAWSWRPKSPSVKLHARTSDFAPNITHRRGDARLWPKGIVFTCNDTRMTRIA